MSKKKQQKDFNLKIGALTYRVIFDALTTAERESYGATNHDGQIIYLDPNLKKDRLKLTFIHEILHVCFALNGLNEMIEGEEKVTLYSENIVRALAPSLTQILIENKDIFKKLGVVNE